MPRHLTLADIGRGASRHRAPRSRWLLPLTGLLLVLALTAGAAVAPGARSLLTGARRPADAACPLGVTPLVVVASADKSALMKRFAADFSATGQDESGRCVHVTIVPRSSGVALTALAAGWTEEPRPDVWSPSGSVWLPLLEARLATAHRPGLVETSGVPSMATSPLVVAMPRPMAVALGWPTAQIGWADLLQLATGRAGWAAFGHPEWGPFLLGKTNPNFSHAGLEGTIATYYAALGRTGGLTPADVASAQSRRFVAGVEQSVVRYGDTTTTFLSDWLRADTAGRAMSYLSAVVTEENVVASYNDGNPTADPAQLGRNPKPHVPLVSIYPREGTFTADHPYAVLAEPWVTPAKRTAAAAFLAYLRSPAVQRSFQANNFRNADGAAGAQATPAVGVLPNQPTHLLEVPPAATTTAVLDGWSQLRKTADMISLIDVSGSMAEPVPGSSTTRLAAAKQAAVESLDLFTDHDEVGLWSFSGGVRGVQDWTERVPIGPMDAVVGGRPRRAAMQAALAGLTASGNTGLYNSLAAAHRAVTARYRADRINAIVLLTDGRNDAVGGLTLDQLLAELQRDQAAHPVPVITIAYGPDADQATLARIARATKGAAYVAPGPADIPKVYAAALSNI